MLGLQVRALEVTKEDEYGVRGTAVRAALEEDAARGKRPFIFGEHVTPASVIVKLITARTSGHSGVDKLGCDRLSGRDRRSL